MVKIGSAKWGSVHALHLALAAKIRERIKAVKERGLACSLYQAMMDVHVLQWEQEFHTLVEAIEDAEALDAKR
jgi:trimethylamine:corrinoid methyltransferase-like protein